MYAYKVVKHTEYPTVKQSAWVKDDQIIFMFLDHESKCHDWTNADVAREHEVTIKGTAGNVHFQWNETGRLGKRGMHVWLSPAHMMRFFKLDRFFKHTEDGEYVWNRSDLCLCLVEIPAGAYVACTKSNTEWKQEGQAMAVSRLKLLSVVERFDRNLLALNPHKDERMNVATWTNQLSVMLQDIKQARVHRVTEEHPLLQAIMYGNVDMIRALKDEKRNLVACLRHLNSRREMMARYGKCKPQRLNRSWSSVSTGITAVLETLDTDLDKMEVMWACVGLLGMDWEAIVCMVRHALSRGVNMTNRVDHSFNCSLGLLLPAIAAGGAMNLQLFYSKLLMAVSMWTTSMYWEFHSDDVLRLLTQAAAALHDVLSPKFFSVITRPLYDERVGTWRTEEAARLNLPSPLPELSWIKHDPFCRIGDFSWRDAEGSKFLRLGFGMTVPI
jgi:hypothetical protein